VPSSALTMTFSAAARSQPHQATTSRGPRHTLWDIEWVPSARPGYISQERRCTFASSRWMVENAKKSRRGSGPGWANCIRLSCRRGYLRQGLTAPRAMFRPQTSFPGWKTTTGGSRMSCGGDERLEEAGAEVFATSRHLRGWKLNAWRSSCANSTVARLEYFRIARRRLGSFRASQIGGQTIRSDEQNPSRKRVCEV
jgi:hypothetical protein